MDAAPSPAAPLHLLPPVGLVRSFDPRPGATGLVLAGELDVLTARELHALEGRCGRAGQVLAVDAGGVTFMDCAGLRAVLAVVRPGGAVRWSRTSPSVDLLLDTLGASGTTPPGDGVARERAASLVGQG